MVMGVLLGGYFAAVLWGWGCDRRLLDQRYLENSCLKYRKHKFIAVTAYKHVIRFSCHEIVPQLTGRLIILLYL